MSIHQIEHLHSPLEESEYCNVDLERPDWQFISAANEVEEDMTTRWERHLNTGPSLRLEFAVTSYKKGNISLGRAAEIADVSYGKMMAALREEGIPLRLGPPVEVAEKRSKRLVEKFKQLRGA